MKKFIGILLTAALAFGAVGCGSTTTNETADEAATTTTEGTTIVVGASPSPHAEILKAAQPLLAEKGITLEIKEFTDYVQPNLALNTGDLDANYFQHQPYLDQFNADNDMDLVALGAVHYEPMGIFAGNSSDLAALPDGAKVGVPNDATNEARALLLLESNGLIKLKEDAGVAATKLDIVENPHNLEIVEMEAAQLPLSLGSLDIAVINGNYALSGGLSISDALAIEEADSLAAETYQNVVAVRNGDETRPELQTLIEVLNSQEIADYINETFEGAVAPVFEAAAE
ncbi:MAG: MetQ/NlpA family ABC transporter substrate-binding protein [Anaerotignum sp.]|nr:putative uncharacterized protein [Firmicutes bacterium CAG:466]